MSLSGGGKMLRSGPGGGTQLALRRHVRVGVVLWPLLVCLVLVAACRVCRAETGPSAAAVYNQANGLYAQGRYAEAIDLYDELVRAGVSNGFLFYNLGNAYFKEGEIGKAILWYARAKRILPRDTDVATNLEFARRVRPDKVKETHHTPVFRAVRAAVLGLNLSELALISFVVYLLTTIFLILMILARTLAVRRIASRGSLILGVALFLCLLWLGGRVFHEGTSAGCVVMARQVDAMSGPGTDYTKVMSLHEGAEAEVEEERDGWYLIKLPSGLGGWIHASAAELI